MPGNSRASQLTAYCGRPTNVLGDAFVSRAIDDNDDLFKRLDFLATEFTPGATWVTQARNENAKRPSQQATPLPAPAQAIKAPAAKKKPPSAAALMEWKKKLQAWADGKLDQWDTDEAFRKARQGTGLACREEYEKFLEGKVRENFKKQTGTDM